MAHHNQLGIKGEEKATEYLLQAGYKIIATNWRYRKGEIDIIAQIDQTIAFVEVKTRATDYFGFPELAVNQKKQRQIIQAADAYLQENEVEYDPRFDVISIILNNSEVQIEHIEDAFYPVA